MVDDPEFGQHEDLDCHVAVHEPDHDATLVTETGRLKDETPIGAKSRRGFLKAAGAV